MSSAIQGSSLRAALDNLSSATQKNREKGLAEIRQYFSGHNAALNHDLKDASYHHILETLFRLASSEKQNYLSGKTANARSKAEVNLSDCADALRLTIKSGSHKFKPKTAKAIIEHVIQLLPASGGGYCAGLTKSYFRVLEALLQRPNHVEGLDIVDWQTTVDFCLEGLNLYCEQSRDPSTLQHSARISSSSRSTSRTASTPKASATVSAQNAQDLMSCLLSLVTASNSPVSQDAENILETLVQFLQLDGSVNTIHRTAFQALNHVLSMVYGDKLELSKSVALRIVPIVCRLWSLRAVAKDSMLNSVRDQMLISLFILDLHLQRLVLDGLNPTLYTDVEALLEVLRNEYSKRMDRDKLQIADITLNLSPDQGIHISSLQMGVLPLAVYGGEQERKWAILYVLGMLERLLYCRDVHDNAIPYIENEDNDGDEGARPRKRQRTRQPLDVLVAHLYALDADERFAALQCAVVLLPSITMSIDVRSKLVLAVTQCVADTRHNIASWALITIALLARYAPLSQSTSIEWTQLWRMSARFLAASKTSRAASYAMDSIMAVGHVAYRDVVDDIEAILTDSSTYGPAHLCDSTLSFMSHLIYIRFVEVPKGANTCSRHVIRWMFQRWHSAIVTDTLMASAVSSLAILNAVRTCLGIAEIKLSRLCNYPEDSIGQSWTIHQSRTDMLHYLLLLEKNDYLPSLEESFPVRRNIYDQHVTASEASLLTSDICFVVGIFHTELTEFLSIMESQYVQTDAIWSRESLKLATSMLILGSYIRFLLTTTNTVEQDRLDLDILRLHRGMMTLLERSSSQELGQALGEAIHPYLPRLEMADLRGWIKADRALLESLAKFSPFLYMDVDMSRNEDVMDVDAIDDLFEVSQNTNFTAVSDMVSYRTNRENESSMHAFYANIRCRAIFLACLFENGEAEPKIPSPFIDHLIQLEDSQLLQCGDLVNEVISSDLEIIPSDITKLLSRAEPILGIASNARNEVALSFFLSLLHAYADSWTNPAGGDIADLSLDMYDYFVKDVIVMHRPSEAVQARLADLFLRLIRVSNSFQLQDLPSAQESLLSLLKGSNIYVKFHIGTRLASLFDEYSLKLHIDLFEDITDNLPSQTEWLEGTLFRLFVLGKLASAWPTVLRSCVFYVLEIAGCLPATVRHASRLLHEVARSLQLNNSAELFHLFASQLLFTWLDGGSFEDIPYMIFGYKTLRELMRECQNDLVGILVMRDQGDQLRKAATILDTNEKGILGQSFPKVIAYSIINDYFTKTSTHAENYVAGDVRVLRTLGKDLFYDHLNDHFTDIIAQLYQSAEQEEYLEKSFSQRKEYAYAAKILNELKAKGSSSASLPFDQQPNFKVRNLPDAIEYVCKHTQYEVDKLYTPAMTVFIARALFNAIHTALGPFHACSVLRKIRVLIALSDTACLNGYCLKMLLHGVRPYITNAECTDDAISIVQYLLEKGKQQLLSESRFVVSFALSTFISLRTFTDASPKSTLLESQQHATSSKARAFHQWLDDYLTNFQYQSVSSHDEIALHSITKTAATVGSVGSVRNRTTEASLLVHILDDWHSRCGFLDKGSRHMAISKLYKDFEMVPSFREDILGKDVRASRYAADVWELCREVNAPQKFAVWVAKILGRHFASTGSVPKQLTRESDLYVVKARSQSIQTYEMSRTSLLLLLEELTRDDNSKTVGMAESILRVVQTRMGDTLSDVEYSVYGEACDAGLFEATFWPPFNAPPSDILMQKTMDFAVFDEKAIFRVSWLSDLLRELCEELGDDVLLPALPRVLRTARNFDKEGFPYILHLALLADIAASSALSLRARLSSAITNWLKITDRAVEDHQRMIINSLLYLRTQAQPDEVCTADRMRWLELDYMAVSWAATRCNMFKAALLFLEISISETGRGSSRRMSRNSVQQDPTELLLTIFQNIDDPDMFYGVEQVPGLDNVLQRLEHEKDGIKSLTFRSAVYDTQLRLHDSINLTSVQALGNALGSLSLNGLSHSLLQSLQVNNASDVSSSILFENACKLEQWDLPVPRTGGNNAATMYQIFQNLNNATSPAVIFNGLEKGFETIVSNVIGTNCSVNLVRQSLQSLAVITEVEDVLSCNSSEQFEQALSRFEARSDWMKVGRFEDVRRITTMRSTLLGSINRQSTVRDMMNINASDARIVEIKTNLLSAELYRRHGALQESLTTASYLTDKVLSSQALGLKVDAVINLETANALWDQGEMVTSIGLLRMINSAPNLNKQTIAIERSNLLAKLGSQVSSAKLEKPDMVVEKYLDPALKELKGKTSGSQAGHVYHEFAVFCDEQLQDPDLQEDLERLRNLKEMKEAELQDLAKLIKSGKTPESRHKLSRALNNAKTWFNLDNEEYTRQLQGRHRLLRQSLENYLLALAASDDHDNDSLRFSVLWLEYSSEDAANEAVAKHIPKVPSHKFISLTNQLTSRLQKNDTSFQRSLFDTVLRICTDHPYHGMYQIWAGIHTKADSNDNAARFRYAATRDLAVKLSNNKSASTWSAVNVTNTYYCQLAAEKNERYRSGAKFTVKTSPAAMKLYAALGKHFIPSPTMQIPIALSLDYSSVPTMAKLDGSMSIASGVSAPKIITVIDSRGARYRQLVKGGNDDLRQDAIMEQVFAQVSELLKSNPATRQRNLGIRTYKVLPLTPTAGIIEFVPNSVPLHDFLMPAHERYYPNDLAPAQARRLISEAQSSRPDQKLKAYRHVASHFHPVMRYFFMEKFHDPEDWFEKRLAYTKSSAATSILGHILGLGDRHGHNILLDEQTGDVIHIDLGVAFEMGRILPVPELIPFRLTRDSLDGMGVTKTEGVFRRCCEFTLEALRKEASSIVAILDVLRYDPLHSWSISPVRLAKLQDAQSIMQSAISDGGMGSTRSHIVVNEPSEADRALTVVKKKLSKTLSVTATVNDLINQATDERHLAALYSGWAAYA